MCGIFFQLLAGSAVAHPPNARLKDYLDSRGPDSQNHHNQQLTHEHGTTTSTLSFYSTVLALRGSEVVPQPLVDQSTGSVLCWNGEAWKINDEVVSSNDTLAVFSHLINASPDDNAVDAVVKCLARIKGPFAFVFFDGRSSKLYYGRDYLGRRSLLIKHESDGFILASVSDGTPGWSEIEPDGIYTFQLGRTSCFPLRHTVQSSFDYSPILSTWQSLGIVPTLNRMLPTATVDPLQVQSQSVLELEQLLRSSLSLRLSYFPSSSPPTCTVSSSADNAQAETIELGSITESRSRLAILFSGGLDCTVLARLAHDILPLEESIDLLNVAFANPRDYTKQLEPGKTLFSLSPDRITGKKSAHELKMVCPGRAWNFMEINITFYEMNQQRDHVISLMSPHDTEMDLSIALALHFASKGDGGVVWNFDKDPLFEIVDSSARILFSGLGADELFGGYQRHATAFKHKEHIGLIDELALDFGRLGKRNLGRDDRVISCWGKEVRYPYLDEELVRWAVATPIWEKCGFGYAESTDDESIEPGKLVLRLLADRLGMGNVAREKKRAIQFGARTAKMFGNTKGTATISKPEVEET